jgi:GNAT superfamily N-acetyltransferase
MVPGVAFRRFQGPPDYAPIAGVFARSWAADGVPYLLSAEDIERLYSHTKNCDPYRDFLLLEARPPTDDGAPPPLIAYGRAAWHDEVGESGSMAAPPPVPIRIYQFKWYMVPEWRGRGLESVLLGYYEQHLAGLAATQDFAGTRVFQTFVADRSQAYVETLEHAGYAEVRYEYEMVRPDLANIPDVPLPAGIVVRPVNPDTDLRAIWEAEVEAFRDHWGFSEPEEGDYPLWLEAPNFQPHLWQVAWTVEGNQVAGMIRNYIIADENARYGRQRGYTEWISVRQPWRRRGLARALLARSLRMHQDLGMTEAALSVDSQNPGGALQLYESMGFRVIMRTTTYRKPLASLP